MKRKQYLVIGVGRFGGAVAESLFKQGHEVVAMDISEAQVARVRDHVTHAFIGDSTDEDALEELGISNFDAVVVAIGSDFEANILTTLAAKAAGAQRVVSKAVSDPGARVLSRVGADVVVRPEHDMGVRVARQLTTPDLVDAFQLGEGHAVIEVEANQKIMGPLAKSRLPNRFGVQVIAVQRGDDVTVSPAAGFEVRARDRLVLLGSQEAVDRFRGFLSE